MQSEVRKRQALDNMRSEEERLTQTQERRSSQRVCLEEVTLKMLSYEERRGIKSVQTGGEAFQGSRNSLCKGRGLTE